MFLQALTFQLGYNATLVTLGAMLLGIAAGVTGTFLFLRKRALVSDAIAHATLPGVALAFIILTALGLDGRWLPGLLLGVGDHGVSGAVGRAMAGGSHAIVRRCSDRRRFCRSFLRSASSC